MLMIGRAVIRAIKADGGRVLVTLDMLSGETSDGVELAEPFGFTSIPLAGSEAVTLAVMGERGNKIAISMGNRSVRPRDLSAGDSSQFDHRGQQIRIVKDGIKIVSPKKLTISAPEVEIEANSATINGKAIATVDHQVNVEGGSSAGLHPIVTGVGDNG
jgi:phage baseplate assembly protein V